MSRSRRPWGVVAGPIIFFGGLAVFLGVEKASGVRDMVEDWGHKLEHSAEPVVMEPFAVNPAWDWLGPIPDLAGPVELAPQIQADPLIMQGRVTRAALAEASRQYSPVEDGFPIEYSPAATTESVLSGDFPGANAPAVELDPEAPQPLTEEELEAFLAEPEFGFRHAVLVQQQRRMRSGELHYIDHPLLGILVKVSRYEFEPFVALETGQTIAGTRQ